MSAPVTMGAPCIAGIGYAFPSASRSLRELHAAGQLESDPALLERFGFDRVYVAEEETPFDLALTAARRLLAERAVDPESVGLLVWSGAPGAMAFASPAGAERRALAMTTMDRFTFPATRLQYELGLTHAGTMALDQLACTSLLGAVRVARAMCLAEGVERALCVSSEFFPARAGREAIWNVTSDAACAVLVERDGARNRIAGSATVTKGYYWDHQTMRDELVASYFPTARHVIDQAVADAGWRSEDVSWVIPHNVSARSWEILLRLAALPNARLWTTNIARRGHTLAGDSFINLRDALCAGDVGPGEKVLLFSYGFGAHWTAMAIET